MAIKISDMEPYGKSISDNDMFEMVAQNELKSYRVSAQNIAEYCKLLNNGGFRGLTSKELSDFAITDCGSWLWSGSSPFTYPEIKSGYVEIISYIKPDSEGGATAAFIQRLSAGEFVYQRIHTTNGWSDWGSLTNRNGNRIVYGVAQAQNESNHVSFSPTFNGNPSVILTVIGSKTDYVYQPQLLAVTTEGFDFIVYRSSKATVVTTETTTTTESGSTKTTKTEYTSERGQWEVATDVSVNWIATREEG